MLSYMELMDILEAKGMSAKSLCEKMDITTNGLRKGMNNQSISMRLVDTLCKAINITPNHFFSWSDSTATQIQNGGAFNTQIADQGIATLQEQLRIKDDQINKLLNIISK